MNFDPTKTMDDVKRDVTIAAIEYHGKSKHKAAKQLKITVRTLDIWLTKWGLFEEYGKRHICNRMSRAEVEAVWTAANFNKERMAQILQCSRITVYKLLVRHKFVTTRSHNYGI